jgi:hypothetical protein
MSIFHLPIFISIIIVISIINKREREREREAERGYMRDMSIIKSLSSSHEDNESEEEGTV